MRERNLKFCTLISTNDTHQIPKNQISVTKSLICYQQAGPICSSLHEVFIQYLQCLYGGAIHQLIRVNMILNASVL